MSTRISSSLTCQRKNLNWVYFLTFFQGTHTLKQPHLLLEGESDALVDVFFLLMKFNFVVVVVVIFLLGSLSRHLGE